MARGSAEGVELARLRVLQSLPRRHQDYFFEAVRTLCTKYIALASRSDPTLDRESEALELFSEAMAKLLGVTSCVPSNEGASLCPDPGWKVADDPKHDDRVAWLIAEVGGPQVIKHRHEDIRRRRYGGKWRDGAYRQIQLEAQHVESLNADPFDPHHEQDVKDVWRGVLAMAAAEFEPNADVLTLLLLMANDPDIQAGFGSEWPISQIVATLNRGAQNSAAWTDDRVENAKKRLRNWIVRLKRTHGLDQIDLMALFARYGRNADMMKRRSAAPDPSASGANARAGWG